jgi:nicotinamide-nucleotide amidase
MDRAPVLKAETSFVSYRRLGDNLPITVSADHERRRMTNTPEQQLFELLGDQDGITVATAESCTGGLVSGRITRIAGSSAYHQGGIVSYSNEAKAHLLGVPQSVLDNPGAVSGECATLMAEGAQRQFGAAFAVSTTGIAGPGGGTDRKPVGLVYIAVAGPDGTVVEEHHFAGDRAQVIEASTMRAMELLVKQVRDHGAG